MRVSPRPSCTRISPESGSGTSIVGPILGPELKGRHHAHELRRRTALDRRASHASREATLVRVRVGRQVGGPRLAPWAGGPRAQPGPIRRSARRAARYVPERGRGRPCRGRAGRAGLAHPALPEPGIRVDQPSRGAGRRCPEQDLHGQFAGEDQRCAPLAVPLRSDLRVRRPGYPDRGRDRGGALPHDPQPDRVQEGDARCEA